jgi:hypothetical protein
MSQIVTGTPLVSSEAEQLRMGLASISAELGRGELLPSTPTRENEISAFLQRLRAVLQTAPKAAWPRLAIAFNDDQVDSKLWLLERSRETMDLSGRRVLILGAWYGVLALLMERLIPESPAEVHCIDIDEPVCDVAITVLSVLSRRPEVRRADMMELDYTALSAGCETVFINTSCEHLADFPGWRRKIPSGARVVLQSNDHRGCPEHVSCVPDLDAFEEQARLAAIDYRGALPLKNFRRFMLIGRA